MLNNFFADRPPLDIAANANPTIAPNSTGVVSAEATVSSSGPLGTAGSASQSSGLGTPVKAGLIAGAVVIVGAIAGVASVWLSDERPEISREEVWAREQPPLLLPIDGEISISGKEQKPWSLPFDPRKGGRGTASYRTDS
ncbi:hypothetical protein BDK51DRAFT_32436 [Blyttiomyces helicus]|uniref:Uncharacterized protein n=1 Tax=Blyttiomyces helicus TaxID=388810 RepID=A0A4V1IQ52_9FUNG|nr:hypothetical protein BDK51DRAFT_32436 [Blyttiomyces helicus]|eukprot:RKO85347.1 hypothetical protein BDK51DRAFT_32436 [Blyttiomyces helicus]